MGGVFKGTDWKRNADWCSHSTSRLFVGRFNDDDRDDLLCHDVVAGTKSIDYANEDGEFNGPDWKHDADWCRSHFR